MDFIFEIPNNLSPKICEDMIKRFEKDDRKGPGITANRDPDSVAKISIDLGISCFKEWKDIDDYLYKQLSDGLDKYKKHLKKTVGLNDALFIGINDSGYQIQKTSKSGYYSWHDDSYLPTNRIITFLWYLNDIDVGTSGGGTIFQCGKQVMPEQGKLLLFPATWTYIHGGLPFIGDGYKYICTGWIHKP